MRPRASRSLASTEGDGDEGGDETTGVAVGRYSLCRLLPLSTNNNQASNFCGETAVHYSTKRVTQKSSDFFYLQQGVPPSPAERTSDALMRAWPFFFFFGDALSPCPVSEGHRNLQWLDFPRDVRGCSLINQEDGGWCFERSRQR